MTQAHYDSSQEDISDVPGSSGIRIKCVACPIAMEKFMVGHMPQML